MKKYHEGVQGHQNRPITTNKNQTKTAKPKTKQNTKAM
jgi:hypothetical protein